MNERKKDPYCLQCKNSRRNYKPFIKHSKFVPDFANPLGSTVNRDQFISVTATMVRISNQTESMDFILPFYNNLLFALNDVTDLTKRDYMAK